MNEALRQTNVFLANIDNVRDMTDQEKKDWKAQVTFLKGYYAFLLVQRYGPIVLPTEMVTPEATSEQLFLKRSKVEDCFNFILTLMNEAIPNLSERATENEWGQVDQVVARRSRPGFSSSGPAPSSMGIMNTLADRKSVV